MKSCYLQSRSFFVVILAHKELEAQYSNDLDTFSVFKLYSIYEFSLA